MKAAAGPHAIIRPDRSSKRAMHVVLRLLPSLADVNLSLLVSVADSLRLVLSFNLGNVGTQFLHAPQ